MTPRSSIADASITAVADACARVAGTLLATLMLGGLAPAFADSANPSTPNWSFSAFGTLGEVHSSEGEADFAQDVFDHSGAGYTRSWSPEVDSRLGAQATANLTAGLSAVLQIVSEQNYDGTYRPHVEWANIKYKITPDLAVRVGRIDLPTFLFSETRLVGYTYVWVRPPPEVYSLNPVETNDGVDVSYRFNAGDVKDTIRANYGRSNTQLPDHNGSTEGRNSWGLTNTAEYGPFTVLLTFQASHLTTAGLDPLFDAFRMFGPAGNAIADQYNDDNKPVMVEQVGGMYDSGHWLVLSEWSHANTHSFLGDQTAWYVTGGYRIGKFTPYVTYAEVRALGSPGPGLPTTGLPPASAGFAAGLDGALSTVLESIAAQHTESAGARWDFAGNFDLKLQLDHTRLGAHSTGELINIQPGLTPGTTVNVASITVDFVF